MRRLILAFAFCSCSLFLAVQTAVGFFSEVIALRAELQMYETAHAADFSDIVSQLDEMTATVFTDVSVDAWFHPYVSSLAEWGIVGGYKDARGRHTGEFRPSNSVTVAEALKMAMGSADVDVGSCTGTPRLKSAAQHWARAYVVCAEQMDARIIEASLRLDRPATRAEVVAIVHDAFDDVVPPLYSQFEDTAGHRYEADVAFGASVGLVGGDTDARGNARGTFRPNDAINRAEAAKIMYERLKLLAKTDLTLAR